jgi:hypothetical protein
MESEGELEILAETDVLIVGGGNAYISMELIRRALRWCGRRVPPTPGRFDDLDQSPGDDG